MNQLSFPMRGLYWKEIRQVAPLVLMLVGVVSFLALIWSVFQTTTHSMATFGQFIPLIMPALYAAGAGAILVGQEKETRTLLWFSSLPISPQQIVQVKFIVALGGLLVMWVCSVLVGSLVGIAGPAKTSFMLTPGDEGFANTLFWILHSFYVLCCGFYTTWKLKNTFASLVVLIPLAVIPYLVVQTGYSLFDSGRFVSIEESAWVSAIITAVAIPSIAWLAYQAAMTHLAPMDVEADDRGPAQWLSAWRPATSVPIPESPFRLSLSSLVWQSIHQNVLTLVGLFALMFVGTVCCVLMISHDINQDFGGLIFGGIVTGFVAVSWLGVFVFNGDGSATRLRFLADRGVSPSIAWTGRQLVGLSMIAALALFYAVTSYWFIHTDYIDRSDYSRPQPVFSMITVGFVALVIYAVSQWTSQLIRILAASAFVAPVFSLIAVVWLFWTVGELEAPAWLMVVCVVIPFVATWWMMRRFMDDNTKWPIWATGIVAACLFFALPMMPLVIDVLTWPTVPAQVRSSLVAEAMKISLQSPLQSSPQLVTLARSDSDDIRNAYFVSEAQALKFLAAHDSSPAGILAMGEMKVDSKVPLEMDNYAVNVGLETAEYHKLVFKRNPSDEQACERLGEWIEAFAVIARRLRLSERWLDQQAADMTEIWLTQTLSEPAMEPYLDQDFAQTAMKVIGDSAFRTAARRRAVLASWRDDQLLPKPDDEYGRDYQFGGFYKSNWFDWYPSTKRGLIEDKLIDNLVATTIRYIEAGSAGEDTEPMRRELHAMFHGPEAPFEGSAYSDELRVSGSPEDGVYWNTWSAPGCQWFAPWEADAKKLSLSRGH